MGGGATLNPNARQRRGEPSANRKETGLVESGEVRLQHESKYDFKPVTSEVDFSTLHPPTETRQIRS